MLYRNTKVKVHSLDRDTDYFDIVAGVLQGDTLALYLFIICLDYVLRTSIDEMKDNSFMLTKERSRRYPAQTITDADYTAFDKYTRPGETLLHSLERTAADIGLHVNAHKMEYMCFNLRGDIFTQIGCSLKLVDKFTYLGSSVSSTETDVNTRLVKTWSYGSQTWPIKKQFFSSSGRVDIAVRMHYMDDNKRYGEKPWRQLHKNAASNIEQVLEEAVRPLTTHHENYPS